MVDAVFAVLRALVLIPVRGLSEWADRTPLRKTLMSAGTVWFRPARRCAQPESAWTITPDPRTPISRAAMRGPGPLPAPVRRAFHLLLFRHAQPAESPGTWTVSDNDEKRDSDQREPARDAGRHHRGRPAR